MHDKNDEDKDVEVGVAGGIRTWQGMEMEMMMEWNAIFPWGFQGFIL